MSDQGVNVWMLAQPVRTLFDAKGLLNKWLLTPKGKVGKVVAHNDHDAVAVQFKKGERVSHLWMMRLSELRGWTVFDDEESALYALKNRIALTPEYSKYLEHRKKISAKG